MTLVWGEEGDAERRGRKAASCTAAGVSKAGGLTPLSN